MTASPHRRLFDVELEPVAGTRFQPTGFPDIGAALFERPERVDGRVEWKEALLLESAQSMANHLERVGWPDGSDRPTEALEGLPYVRVVDGAGRFLTSSRLEAHRLASAFVKDSTLDGQDMKEIIRERLGLRDDTPLSPREIAGAVFALDPLCLVHGVFFAESSKVWPGQPKIARALTAFVEALDVRAAISGGVKRDLVRHAISEEAAGSSEGYGSIPFHRTEYSAGRIVASFCVDNAQIAAYGLGERAEALLRAIALWEIRGLLDGGLRLRTACDLVPIEQTVADRAGEPLPGLDELTAELRNGVTACSELLGGGGPIEVSWGGGKKRPKAASKAGPAEG